MMAFRQQPYLDPLFPQRNTSPRSQALFLDRLPAPAGASPYLPLANSALSLEARAMMAQSIMAARIHAAQQAQDMQLLLRQMQPLSPPRRVFPNQNIHDRSPTSRGLDLLRSVSLSLSDGDSPQSQKSIGVSTTSSAFQHIAKVQPLSSARIRQSSAGSFDTSSSTPEQHVRLYVDQIQEGDVLCGRGGRSNHHPGNKRYRLVVSEMKAMYRTTDAKNLKTDLSRAIVEHVCNYGGRFVKKDEKQGKYYLLTKAEARRKTSQALRETKELKWTL